MPWIAATLLSAALLGGCDLCIKHSVRENAVLPVLFFANLCSACIWLTLLFIPVLASAALPGSLAVAPLHPTQHLLLLAKSALVSASWICSYFAVKHLPVSVAAPIRATGPIWTCVGALLWLHEHPSGMQFLGIATTLASFFGLSLAGRREGIHFGSNRWVWWLCAGAVLNGLSGLYDKFLLGRAGFTAATVQAWFSIYLALLFLPLAIGWKLRWWPRQSFQWRWSIIGVSIALLGADFVYFDALRNPHALISVVSSLRRGSTLVAFAGGLWLFHETNGRRKLPAVLGLIAGIVLTVAG